MKKISAILFVAMLVFGAQADNVKFSIQNMHCQNCANRVEKALRENKAVQEVSVDIEDKIVCVKYDEKEANAEALLNALKEAKFEAEIAKQCKGDCKKHSGEGEHKCKGDHKDGEHKCHKENK